MGTIAHCRSSAVQVTHQHSSTWWPSDGPSPRNSVAAVEMPIAQAHPACTPLSCRGSCCLKTGDSRGSDGATAPTPDLVLILPWSQLSLPSQPSAGLESVLRNECHTLHPDPAGIPRSHSLRLPLLHVASEILLKNVPRILIWEERFTCALGLPGWGSEGSAYNWSVTLTIKRLQAFMSSMPT